MRLLRVVASSLTSQLDAFLTISTYRFVAFVQPLVLASIACAVASGLPRDERFLYAALGAAWMGAWSSVVFTSAFYLRWEKWSGTLDLLLAAPSSLAAVLGGSVLASAVLGLMSFAASLLWAGIVFDVPAVVESPCGFALSLGAAVLSWTALGLVLSTVFFLLPTTSPGVMHLLQYVGWILGCAVYPIDVLPHWARPLSMALAPSWAAGALRLTARGAAASAWGPMVGAVLGLSAAYCLLAHLALVRIARGIRSTGHLA